MPSSVLGLTAAAPGDTGPATVLKNKSCGTSISVTFEATLGGGAHTLVNGAPAAPGEYGNPAGDPVWELYGPNETAVTLSGTALTNPRTFTPDYPGRWFIRLTATPFGSSETVYTAVIDIRDPQFSGASIPAPNETNEFDTALGWSRDAEEMHKTLSRTLGFREIVSVSSTVAIAAGKTVMPSTAWFVQWKSATASFADFNNFAIDVVEVNDGSADLLNMPVFLLLEAVDPTVGSGQEKALALVKGAIPYDTQNITGGPAAGADVYLDNTGAQAFNGAAPGVGNRIVGKVLVQGLDTTTPNPGVLYFDGHYEGFFHQLYIGNKLTVGGLIDPTGLELTAVTANPGAAETLWVDSTAGNALKFGTQVVMPLGGVSAKYNMAVDPALADDTTGGYAEGDVWVNNLSDEVFVCADSTAAAAVWRRVVPHSDAADPTVTDDDSAMYTIGDRWFNTASKVNWVCTDASTGAAVWQRETWEVIATTAAVATAEHKVHYVCTDPVGGGYTITAPAGAPDGMEFRVTNNDPTPDTITVDGNGANIVGAANKTLPAQYDSYKFSADGVEWFLS